eukprot:974478-Prorocentrum_minimum.AAC.3
MLGWRTYWVCECWTYRPVRCTIRSLASCSCLCSCCLTLLTVSATPSKPFLKLAYLHDGPIRRRKHGYVRTTDQSDAGSTGIFSRWTSHTQEARVYIFTTDESSATSARGLQNTAYGFRSAIGANVSARKQEADPSTPLQIACGPPLHPSKLRTDPLYTPPNCVRTPSTPLQMACKPPLYRREHVVEPRSVLEKPSFSVGCEL